MKTLNIKLSLFTKNSLAVDEHGNSTDIPTAALLSGKAFDFMIENHENIMVNLYGNKIFANKIKEKTEEQILLKYSNKDKITINVM